MQAVDKVIEWQITNHKRKFIDTRNLSLETYDLTLKTYHSTYLFSLL